MTAQDIRTKYIKFFESKGHKEIPPAPIVPLNDPTTLFTSSGMQPLVPYLKGEAHPLGTRLVDSQPSFRAEDISEVGDNRHTTFFEMLGNWSLGDYFKEEQLAWFWEFLTEILKLPKEKLWISIFDGDDQFRVLKKEGAHDVLTPDVEAKDRWIRLGVDEGHIKSYSAKKNWWSRAGTPANMPVGEIGGPDSEVFYDFGSELKLHENSAFKNEECHMNCDCGRFMEIGNSVFMQYEKIDERTFKELPKKNVDFGGGLERLAAAANNNPDVFLIDLFYPVIKKLEEVTRKKYDSDHQSNFRVIADHLRAAVFIAAEGIIPSNKLQGYVLRRLIRRAIVKYAFLNEMELKEFLNEEKLKISELSTSFIEAYSEKYSHLSKNKEQILNTLNEEQDKFKSNMNTGYAAVMKVINKPETRISGEDAFYLFQSHGILAEVLAEVAKRFNKEVDWPDFEKRVKEHQNNSRTTSTGFFKGGLADQSESIVKFHTATHLLHKALRDVLGDHVQQMGSHITADRLRFDFKHPAKLTDEQKQKVETIINEKIKADLPVHKTIEPKDAALKSGALAFFREKYPDTVSVYTIGKDPRSDWYSKELCGGPHVSSTGQIGAVTIKKEEAVGAGIRRLYIVRASA